MNILNHLIKPDCIQGIGPLMQEASDPALKQNSFRYYFQLHLTGHTTTIYSLWFPFSDSSDVVTKQVKRMMAEFRREYMSAREKIYKELIKQSSESFKCNL